MARAGSLTEPEDGCPICGGVSGIPVWAVPFTEIWRTLAHEWRAPLSAELRSRYTPQAHAVLVRCLNCDLEYFSPHDQGQVDFYRELMAHIAYEANRWEFGIVQRRLGHGDAVVDYGCGSGAFMGLARPAVARIVGVDSNPDAIANLQARGYEAFCGTPSDFADASDELFDVACAFQVIEHLSSADELLRPLLARLRLGGRVFMSVPNRQRAGKAAVEPLDCPPHHVSRWSATALKRLADRYGLELIRIDFQPPQYGDVTRAIDTRLERVTRALPDAPARLAVKAVRRTVIGPRRHAMLNGRGWWVRHAITGHTILAESRRRRRRPSR